MVYLLKCMANETILIIEDAAVSLKLMATVLRSEGYRVHIASTAEQALMTLRTIRPDLILTDIQLPGIDGFELTRLIRADSRLKDIPVVALTASAAESDRQRAQDAGCSGYLLKPIDTRNFGAQIRQSM